MVLHTDNSKNNIAAEINSQYYTIMSAKFHKGAKRYMGDMA